MRVFRGVVFSLLASLAVCGQAPQFEVASIRPTQSSGPEHSNFGLRLDGSQAHINAFSIRDYIAMAYRVKAYQVTGPEWIATEHFDLDAKLPSGSAPGQIPEMLQALLSERFQLKMHHGTKDSPVYALIVGKAPLKLTATAPGAGAGDQTGLNFTGGGSAEGVSMNLGNGSYYTFGSNKFEARKIGMDVLTRLLEQYVDRPILNQTELAGSYDITLNLTPEDFQAMLIRAAVNNGILLPPQAVRFAESNSPGSLFEAVQQLGLKLDARKAPLDLLVIDQVLKTPTEN